MIRSPIRIDTRGDSSRPAIIEAGGLAGSRRPDENHELRVADVQVEVVNRDDVAKRLVTFSKVTVAISK